MNADKGKRRKWNYTDNSVGKGITPTDKTIGKLLKLWEAEFTEPWMAEIFAPLHPNGLTEGFTSSRLPQKLRFHSPVVQAAQMFFGNLGEILKTEKGKDPLRATKVRMLVRAVRYLASYSAFVAYEEALDDVRALDQEGVRASFSDETDELVPKAGTRLSVEIGELEKELKNVSAELKKHRQGKRITQARAELYASINALFAENEIRPAKQQRKPSEIYVTVSIQFRNDKRFGERELKPKNLRNAYEKHMKTSRPK